MRQCYGWSLPYGVPVHAKDDFDSTGEIINASVTKRLRMLARDSVIYGELLRGQFQRDLESSVAETFAARYRK